MADELLSHSAVEQARMVREGEVASRELVEASLRAVAELNDELNAFVTTVAERALREAEQVSAGDARPLAGVPIAVKDLFALTGGIRTTAGMTPMEDWAPHEDGNVVRRLRRAGAIVIGKTNTPELGILPVTEPQRFGPARNPWDTSRTPGGSSGGSAAAVAAGIVAFGHGNDGGGSIRIPASCCGLVGLKPQRGRVSVGPEMTESGAGLPVEGCLTRTVLDTALGLDVLAGYEPGDTWLPPPPSGPFADAARREPGRLRIGFSTVALNGVPVDQECERAVRDAAELLESLGHAVEEAPPDLDADAFAEQFVRVWIAEIEDDLHHYERLYGDGFDRSQLEPLTSAMIEAGRTIPTADYLASLDYLRRFSREVIGMWDQMDVLVTPTLALPPVEIGRFDPKGDEPPIAMLMNTGEWVPFTPPWNVTGQPAISLPLHWTPDGLPVGVQFIGPPAGEELLLSLAGQLEQAKPWADRRPKVAAAA